MNQEVTIAMVGQALDAAIMRQTAIANNIANTNTAGYKTIEVNFEEQLESSRSDRNGFETENPDPGIKPFYQISAEHSSLDEQIALSIKNATHYRALIKGLNQKLSIMKLALQGNNQS